jgi:hypothetical protein
VLQLVTMAAQVFRQALLAVLLREAVAVQVQRLAQRQQVAVHQLLLAQQIQVAVAAVAITQQHRVQAEAA